MDTEIKRLSDDKTSQSSMENLKQKKVAMSNYIQQLEDIKKVETKYYTALTTTTGRAIMYLKSDIKALDISIKQCKKDIKDAEKNNQSTNFDRRRLEGLEQSRKVLSSLTKKGKLQQAIDEIEYALDQEVKPFDDLLIELDKKFPIQQKEHHILFMPDSPLSSKKEDKKTKLEQNKQEKDRLMALLDTVKVQGKIITKEEKKKWDEIERKIEALEYEIEALKPNNSPKVNEEIIQSLKESMRLTLALSEGKNDKTKERATLYFKQTKQTIKEMRQEDENLEKDDSYSLNK